MRVKDSAYSKLRDRNQTSDIPIPVRISLKFNYNHQSPKWLHDLTKQLFFQDDKTAGG